MGRNSQRVTSVSQIGGVDRKELSFQGREDEAPRRRAQRGGRNGPQEGNTLPRLVAVQPADSAAPRVLLAGHLRGLPGGTVPFSQRHYGARGAGHVVRRCPRSLLPGEAAGLQAQGDTEPTAPPGQGPLQALTSRAMF